MNMMNFRKGAGFTLIELLIVVTIIGLLASVVLVGLQGFRSSGRDARRLADLRQVQNGLEQYFNKCDYYPGVAEAVAPCGPPIDIFSNDPVENWRNLEDALVNSDIGIYAISNDPLATTPDRGYRYATSPNNQSYVLRAELEDPNNPALRNDIDDDIFGVGLDCADEPPHSYYCISL